MKTWKRFLPDVLVVVLFAVISFAYFFVPVTQGKILYRHDASAGVGSAQEMTEYQNRTGEATRWTNAIFGGMPTYQMSPSYQSTDGLSQVMNAYHLWLPDNVWFLFVYLLGFIFCCEPLTSDSRWRHWVVSCGLSRPISSSSLLPVTSGR